MPQAMLIRLASLAGLWIPLAWANPPTLPPIQKLRFAEDYRTLQQSLPLVGLDSLKLLPLGETPDFYLSLGGEVRQRYEYTHNPGFGADPQDDYGVWLQRFTLHGDLHLGQHLRLFTQLYSALETGREDPSPVDENRLALQNAFIEVGSPQAAPGLRLRAGRQEINLGSGRLVDVREGPNVRRSFDALRLDTHLEGWQASALLGRPRLTRPGSFDDQHNDDQALWGLYTSSPSLPLGQLDLYYLGFESDDVRYVQGVADETRHSLGLRWYGQQGHWDWNWEAVYQFGDFGDADISAWTLATDTGYTWKTHSWQPRLGLSANIASGDDDPDDNTLESFNALYPRGNYFSEAAVLGPRNFFNIHPFLSIQPAPRWSITTDVNFFWRLETEDGVYGPPGNLLRAPGDSNEHFVGSAVSVNLGFQASRELSVAAIYSHFFPGDFISDTGPDEAIDFIELTAQWRF